MVNRETEKHLVKVSGDVYTEKCCQTTKTPHVKDFTTSVGCNLDTRKKVDKTRGQWLWGKEGKKWRLRQQQICCLTPFKSRHLRIKDLTFLRRQFPSHHLERQLWTEMDWVDDNGYRSFRGVLCTLTRLPRVNTCTFNWGPDLMLSFPQHLTSLCVSLHH